MRIIASITLLSGAVFCQTFDIADVYMSPRSEWSPIRAHWVDGGLLGGDRYELRRATMLDLIKNAYSVDANKVIGGPAWLDYDRYTIVAKTRPGTKPVALKQMLQALLAERFHLVLRTEMQPLPGLVLSVLKDGPKMKRSDGQGATGCQHSPALGESIPKTNTQCRNVSMQAFAEILHERTTQPVLDATGLDGSWNFDLQFTGGGPGQNGIVGALNMLGLKAESGNVPQPVLKVESVTEQPSPNPPGIAEALPPRPAPEFEVASVRPCEDNITATLRYDATGQIRATCEPVLGLIRDAWKLQGFQRPIGAPKSFEDRSNFSNVSIVAKAPDGVAHDRDTLNAMLKALLIERYQMKVHYEDRPMDTGTLVALKPKLTKADPAQRTGCARQSRQPQGGGILIHLGCHNMTMDQFAELLPAVHRDLPYTPLNATGLEGGWDFEMEFDLFAGSNSPLFRHRAAPAAEGQAPDPDEFLSFEDALQKQLGLKLEMSKRPQPVLIIDHMEEKPLEN